MAAEKFGLSGDRCSQILWTLMSLETGRRKGGVWVEVGGWPPGPVKESGWGRGGDREDQGPG